MSAKHVFFFRGLSTYGSDNARWTIFEFGPMHRNLERALGERGLTFHPVLGMGAGTLLEVQERAFQFLQNHPVWKDPSQRVHFIGHSAGGLVARLLLSRPDIPKGKVLSLLTVATPHNGALLADVCRSIPTRYRGTDRIMRAFGYHMSRHYDFFNEFTRDGLRAILANRPMHAAAESLKADRVGSLVCASPRKEWCRPLKIFYLLPAFHDFDQYTDGMIERDTQPFGEVFDEIKIDHFREVGLFGEPQRFNRMCDRIHDFFATT